MSIEDEIIWATSTTGEEFQCVDASFAREQAAEIAKLKEALGSLLPGLILDLRYANDDDDKDAMRSRIKTVEEALGL